MSWLYLGVVSGLLIGVYDLFKKGSVTGNAVFPVLLLSNLTAALVWAPLMVVSGAAPQWLTGTEFFVDSLTLEEHGLLFLKSAIVGTSWLFGYFAVKHLPITIIGNFRAIGPIFTILGAFLFFAETPDRQQSLGIALTLGFFIALSVVGKREGIHFGINRWVWLGFTGVLLGASSGLYDRYLLAHYGFSPATVQAWFSVYLFLFMLPPAVGWLRGWWARSTFHWRWSIPLTGLTLLLADFFYFRALAEPDAMVSIVACLRRGSILVTFLAGTLIFREKQFLSKLPCVLGILAGIVLILTSLG